ncbi:ataxin-10 isoform X2 [Callorhinchus milii]|uniref:ataxin-10 isoform X2 n=1 Tax=Callorhinchus milii TaxID=7868 RepID=UPI001C3F5CBE|nr:ataxin-10 isoform X2 [Callorhinchus milii]
MQDRSEREEATQCVFESLKHILKIQLTEMELFTEDPNDNRNEQLAARLQLSAECFRCLRNACVQCGKNQNLIRNVGLVQLATQILQVLHRLKGFQEDVLSAAFRCGLQFLGNLATGNEESQGVIWKNAFPDMFLNYLKCSDEKAVAYCCMVLFSCLSAERTDDLLTHDRGIELVKTVVNICRTEPELDWACLLVTDQFLKCPDVVAAVYTKLNNRERITLLDLITAKLNEKMPSSVTASTDASVPMRVVQFLAECFKENCKAVLGFASAIDEEDEEALIVIRLLDILCETTSNHDQFIHLQNSPGLVETVVELLRRTHLAGKQNRNIFSASQSSAVTDTITHPAMGFKAHLIRLIGNLCYGNKTNQDKVREIDGIPLILDNCSIDDNNPFMSQWAVFAIRNLTEQNIENQQVIAQMERQGVADSTMLKGMGFQAEERNGKLYLKSSKNNP